MVNFDSMNLLTSYDQQNVGGKQFDDSIDNETYCALMQLPLDMLENLDFSNWKTTQSTPFDFLGPGGYDEFIKLQNLDEFLKIYEYEVDPNYSALQNVYHDHCYCKEQLDDAVESNESDESFNSISSDKECNIFKEGKTFFIINNSKKFNLIHFFLENFKYIVITIFYSIKFFLCY